MGRNGRRAAFGFGLIAVTLATASLAFACTVFKGTFTVTPDSGGGSAVTATGDNRGMAYCTGGAPATATLPSGGGFTASVAPSTGSCASQLSTGLYTVTWSKGTGTPTSNDCMNLSANQLGTLVVTSTGSASGHYSLGQPSGDYQVCVSDPLGNQGEQVPVKVL
jgi:hypothetical protein